MSNSFGQNYNLTSVINETKNCSYATQIVLAFLGLCFIVGTPIHCFSLWVLLRKSITPSLVFPLNICILELLFCFQCLLQFILSYSLSMSLYMVIFFWNGLCWTARPLLQICMCLEHYLAVIHPVTFLKYKGYLYRVAVIVAIWIIAFCNTLRLFFMELSIPDYIFLIFFVIAVMTTSFCCTSILRALKDPRPGDRNNVQMTERGGAVENKQKRKAFRIISHTLTCILVCYLPLVLIFFMSINPLYRIIYQCKDLMLALSCLYLLALLIAPIVRMVHDSQLTCKMWLTKLAQVRK